MGQEEVSSLSICLSIYLSTNNKLWAPLENKMRDIFKCKSDPPNLCNIDPAVNQETRASGRRYQDITWTVDGLNSVQLRRPREAGGCHTII